MRVGTRVKFAEWRRVGRLFVVQPPNWPKNCELSFTDQGDMMRWASAEHVMLRDANKRDYKGK
jgi:hypothetical protein